MRSVLAWFRRLIGTFRGERHAKEIACELEAHLAMQIEDNIRSGMSAGEARRQALIRFGGVDRVAEEYRDRSGVAWLEAAMKDLQFAGRMMRRNPGFGAVVVLTLAIGIGANSAVFTVVNALLLRPLPYRDPSRLLSVQTVTVTEGRRSGATLTSPPDFYVYRDRNHTLERVEAFYATPLNLTGGREPERIRALVVSAGFFAVLGAQPALGRGLMPQEEQWGSHRVAVLTHGFWQRRFAADPAIVGRTIALDGEPYAVIGVLAPAFSFLATDAELYLPMAFAPGDGMNSHSNYFLSMIGRLKPGVTREQASADLNRLSEWIIAQQSVNQGTAIELTSLRDVLVGGVRRVVVVMLAAVALVLLIACANLANLLLARASVRQREIAVRLAVGATPRRLLRQFLIEGLALSLAGGAAGLIVADLAITAVNTLSPDLLPRAEPIRIDLVVLTFTSAVAVFTGTALGLAPAVHTAGADMSGGLKEGTRSASDSTGRHRLRTALVSAQVALSIVLLSGAGLMIKSFYRLLHVEAGFRPEGVLTLQINLPARKYVDQRLERELSPRAYERAARFFAEIIDGVRSVSGTGAVGATNGLPLMGQIWGKRVTLYDRPLPPTVDDLFPIQYRVVAGDYFEALGIRIVSGRAFTDRDTLNAPNVVIVNREMVRRYWNGADPIGRMLSVNPPLQLLPASVIEEARRAGTLPLNYEPARFTVVGVAEDVLYGGLNQAPLPLVYAPYAQASEGSTNMFLVVRADRDPLSLVGAIREQIARVDRDQPVASVETMESRVAASVARQRLQTSVLAVFAGLAIRLAAIGIYGVMSYTVTQRAHEIGVRVALGAGRGDVLTLVMRQGLLMVGVGVAIGIAGALLTTRALRTLLFGVGASDPSVFAVIVLVLGATACAACYVPARRAASLDPVVTLRGE